MNRRVIGIVGKENRNERVFGKVVNGVPTRILFTREALWGCKDWDIIPDVAADLIPEAAEYIMGKAEGDRFTIVSEALRTLISGIKVYGDEEEMELLITDVCGDVYIIKRHDHFKID